MSPFAKGDPRASEAAKKAHGQGKGPKAYWAQFTPEQRSAMVRKRLKKRYANAAAKLTPQDAGRKGGLRAQAKRGNGKLSHDDKRRIIRNATDRLSTGPSLAEFQLENADARVILARVQAAALEILNAIATLRTLIE